MRATKIVATLGPSPDSRDVIRRLAEARVDVFRVERLPRDSRRARRGFDPVVATRAYLNTVSPEKKARSDAYFETGTGLSCGTSFMRWRSRSCCFKLDGRRGCGARSMMLTRRVGCRGVGRGTEAAANVAHLGSAAHDHLSGDRHSGLSGIHRAALQSVHGADRRKSPRPDPLPGSLEWNTREVGGRRRDPSRRTDPRRVFVSLHSRAQHLHPDVRI
jgi:hypothetical protein